MTLCIVLMPLSIFAENIKSARWYKIYWQNIYIADIKVSLGENDITANIDSRGVIRKISKYSNYTYSKFNKDSNAYTPEFFKSSLTQRQGRKDVYIKYDATGKTIEEKVTPPDNRGKRPAVKEELKDNAYNPLMAAIITRDKIRSALDKNEKRFNLNIYDGRRLSRLEFKIAGMEKIKNQKKILNVVKISFKRIPVAGFTNNELKRMKDEEPSFTVYLDSNSLLPVKADAVAPLGKAYFALEKECDSIEACK